MTEYDPDVLDDMRREAEPFCEAMPSGALCGRSATKVTPLPIGADFAYHCDEHGLPIGSGSIALDKTSSASRQHFIDTGHYLPEGERIAQD